MERRTLAEFEDEGLSLPGRWVNSHDLLAGDVVQSRDGRRLVVRKLEQEYVEAAAVYNLTVESDHTFAVGPDLLLVHNTSPCKPFELDVEHRIEFRRLVNATDGEDVLHHVIPIKVMNEHKELVFRAWGQGFEPHGLGNAFLMNRLDHISLHSLGYEEYVGKLVGQLASDARVLRLSDAEVGAKLQSIADRMKLLTKEFVDSLEMVSDGT